MNIRLMKIADYETVYSIWSSSKGMGLNSLDDSKDGIIKFLVRNPDTCFVAEMDGNIIGAILIGNDGRRGYIYHTAVQENYQKQGIGKALVEAGIRALKEIGINKVALVVFDKNISGNLFWEKLGFTKRNDLVYRDYTINNLDRIDT
ncbi:MAG: GNAT family N-acetyltransferase [Eubacterium sp.]|nr:GNAT family N-acetyltransferase [Eubacterium sp.]